MLIVNEHDVIHVHVGILELPSFVVNSLLPWLAGRGHRAPAIYHLYIASLFLREIALNILLLWYCLLDVFDALSVVVIHVLGILLLCLQWYRRFYYFVSNVYLA